MTPKRKREIWTNLGRVLILPSDASFFFTFLEILTNNFESSTRRIGDYPSMFGSKSKSVLNPRIPRKGYEFLAKQAELADLKKESDALVAKAKAAMAETLDQYMERIEKEKRLKNRKAR